MLMLMLKRIIWLILWASLPALLSFQPFFPSASALAQSQQPQLSKENYFGLMPKVYARLIEVDVVERLITAEVEADKRQVTLHLPPDADVWRFGDFGDLSEFSPGMRAVLFPKIDDHNNWLELRVLCDEITYQAITNSKIMTEPGFKSARKAHRSQHDARLKGDGLTAVVNDVNLTNREILLTINRNANHWALRLHQYETVQLIKVKAVVKAGAVEPNPINPINPISVLVVSVHPDGEHLKIRLGADGTKLARFSLGDEVRILVDPSVLWRQEWLPDYVKNQSLEDQASYLLAWVYCSCDIAGLNCGGQILGVHACTHECHMPAELRQEVIDLFKEGFKPDEIISRLQQKHGDMIMVSHLLLL